MTFLVPSLLFALQVVVHWAHLHHSCAPVFTLLEKKGGR